MSPETPCIHTTGASATPDPLRRFLSASSETTVIYRYLDMLAERTLALEQRIGLDELRELRRENQLLRAQLAQQGKAPLESLLVFLPIIYRNFWSVVRPDELAALAGTLRIPAIPSPYPEPDSALVSAMRKRFKQLPDQERAALVDFCHQLPFRLTVRSEMRDLLEQRA
jgi:hypothetical protein